MFYFFGKYPRARPAASPYPRKNQKKKKSPLIPKPNPSPLPVSFGLTPRLRPPPRMSATDQTTIYQIKFARNLSKKKIPPFVSGMHRVKYNYFSLNINSVFFLFIIVHFVIHIYFYCV